MNAAAQLVFLTGQSDPRHCELSALQRAVGTRLATLLEVPLHPHNFPWFPDELPPAPALPSLMAPGLLRASWHNARQYLAAQRADFARLWHSAWTRLLAQSEHTWLLAGSCGLALLAGLRPDRNALARLRVLAYGPVSRQLPVCPTLLLQGRGDRLSRHWVPHPDQVVAGDHLHYLHDPQLLTLALDWFGGQR